MQEEKFYKTGLRVNLFCKKVFDEAKTKLGLSTNALVEKLFALDENSNTTYLELAKKFSNDHFFYDLAKKISDDPMINLKLEIESCSNFYLGKVSQIIVESIPFGPELEQKGKSGWSYWHRLIVDDYRFTFYITELYKHDIIRLIQKLQRSNEDIYQIPIYNQDDEINYIIDMSKNELNDFKSALIELDGGVKSSKKLLFKN